MDRLLHQVRHLVSTEWRRKELVYSVEYSRSYQVYTCQVAVCFLGCPLAYVRGLCGSALVGLAQGASYVARLRSQCSVAHSSSTARVVQQQYSS